MMFTDIPVGATFRCETQAFVKVSDTHARVVGVPTTFRFNRAIECAPCPQEMTIAPNPGNACDCPSCACDRD